MRRSHMSSGTFGRKAQLARTVAASSASARCRATRPVKGSTSATSAENIIPIVKRNVDRETYILTDEASVYRHQFRDNYLGHGRVNHVAGEYARGRIHTNTVEGYFSIFKRGMRGVYQHCSEKHLHRYLAEFDFRYNNRIALGVNDGERAVLAMKGIEGKRLTYRPTH